ncbi:hypothetical protein BD770DRAFT_392130 [Pilaira anomala]|nr:hypothetical protein BD770DRAFT_392130 [Pilaira anomala]
MRSFCDTMISQYEKILKYEDDRSENSRKRLRQYAKDGIEFAKQFRRRRLSLESPFVTPIRSRSPEKPNDDLIFVNNERFCSIGRFNWASFYKKGRDKGVFGRYSSHLTLKQAFTKGNL